MTDVRAGILTMTDLTPGSDAALRVAGRVAEREGVEVDVLYALGLKGQPLRQAAPALARLESHIGAVDRAVREQAARLFPPALPVRGPVIDFDGSVEALRRRAGQLRPRLVVLPTGAQPGVFGALRLCSEMIPGAPILLVSPATAAPSGRVLLLVEPDVFGHELVESACCWLSWLRDVSTDGDGECVPDVDALFVDAEPGSMLGSATGSAAELVVLPTTVVRPDTMQRIIGVVADTAASVLLLPPDAGAPEIRREAGVIAPLLEPVLA